MTVDTDTEAGPTASSPASPGAGAARRRPTGGRSGVITAWLFLLPFALVYVVSFLGPIAASVWNSLFQVRRSRGGLAPPTTVFAGFDNYLTVLGSNPFWTGMVRVLVFGALQIPFMIFGALALALLLDSLSARFVGVARIAYFLPYAIPGVVAAMVWSYLYSPQLNPFVGLLTALGLPADVLVDGNVLLLSMANITTWTFTGYNMLIFMSALKTIPDEVYDAARIDGAGAWTIARRVKLPMVRNALLLTVLLSIIGTVQLFNEPFVLRRVADVSSDYTPMMMAYNAAFGSNNLGLAGAISVVLAAIAGILAFLYSALQARAAR